MKVKCRGYVGELIELSSMIEEITKPSDTYRKYRTIAYELRIALDNANLTLENVKDNEIELIKE